MKNSRKPFIIQLGYITIVTTIIWIAYSTYSAFNKPIDMSIPPETLQPFEASLDEQALSALQQSIYLTEEELTSTIVDATDSSSVVTIEEPEVEPEVIIEDEAPADNEES